MTRFAIAAGGTGGHLFPGLAVAEVLHQAGHQVLLLTSEKQIDAIATEGRTEFQVERLPGMGLPRGISWDSVRFLARFLEGIRSCRALFRRFQPAAVLGMGGFTSTAPILAGRLMGLPVFVHESNAIPGKANRLNARLAGGWLAGFPECVQRIPSVPCTVTGTPVRRAFLTHPSRAEALALFGLDPARKTLLVMGGSQGAAGVNAAMMEAAVQMQAAGVDCQFIHITGSADEAKVRAFYQQTGIPAWTAPFHHAMQNAYSAADLAVARSGAASLTELAFFGLPSVLIPYPYAAEDHQTFNAQIFSGAGRQSFCRSGSFPEGAWLRSWGASLGMARRARAWRRRAAHCTRAMQRKGWPQSWRRPLKGGGANEFFNEHGDEETGGRM